MFKIKRFIIIELSLVIIYLILNYFFGNLFHTSTDCFSVRASGINCEEMTPFPVYLAVINLVIYASFFLYLFIFIIHEIVAYFKKN